MKFGRLLNQSVLTILARSIWIILSGAIIFYSFFVVDSGLRVKFDFISFITGAKILQAEPSQLYDINTQYRTQKEIHKEELKILPFRNPPPVALVFLPLANLPIELSHKILVITNLFLLILCARLLSKEFKNTSLESNLATSLLFLPTIFSVIFGQVTIFLLLIWIVIFKVLKTQKSISLGLLTGILFNKPQFLIVAPFLFLLSKNRKRFVLGLFMSILAFFLLSLSLVGFKGLSLYPNFLAQTESSSFGSDELSQITLVSLFLFLGQFLNLSRGSIYLVNLIIYISIFLFFSKIYKRNSLERNFVATTLFLLPLAGHAWDHDLVLILIPIFYFLAQKRYLYFSILFLSWLLRFLAYPFFISIVLLGVGFRLLSSKNFAKS